ncbi:hypothetical protein LR48_Vigan2356s000100 [Vigna angularis]|nr:hypothetical protein LR48_Vigan2356s000100 [Vigna angularis]
MIKGLRDGNNDAGGGFVVGDENGEDEGAPRGMIGAVGGGGGVDVAAEDE